jgi:hypothetical protein
MAERVLGGKRKCRTTPVRVCVIVVTATGIQLLSNDDQDAARGTRDGNQENGRNRQESLLLARQSMRPWSRRRNWEQFLRPNSGGVASVNTIALKL